MSANTGTWKSITGGINCAVPTPLRSSDAIYKKFISSSLFFKSALFGKKNNVFHTWKSTRLNGSEIE